MKLNRNAEVSILIHQDATMKFFQLYIFCLFCGTLSAQNSFSALFHTSETPFEYLEKASWEEFNAKQKEYASNGYRLIDLEAYTDQETTFWAIWKKDTTSIVVERIDDWSNMVRMKRKMAKEAYLLDDLEAYTDPSGHLRYLAIWSKIKKPQKHKMWKLDSWAGLKKKNDDMSQDYMILKDVEPFIDVDQKVRFLAVYHPASFLEHSNVFYSSDNKAFYTDRIQRRKSGYRMIDFEAFEVDGKIHYYGVFHSGDFLESLRQSLDLPSLKAHEKHLKEKDGLQIVDLELHGWEGRTLTPEEVK